MVLDGSFNPWDEGSDSRVSTRITFITIRTFAKQEVVPICCQVPSDIVEIPLVLHYHPTHQFVKFSLQLFQNKIAYNIIEILGKHPSAGRLHLSTCAHLVRQLGYYWTRRLRWLCAVPIGLLLYK